jgi:hypothetical protein
VRERERERRDRSKKNETTELPMTDRAVVVVVVDDDALSRKMVQFKHRPAPRPPMPNARRLADTTPTFLTRTTDPTNHRQNEHDAPIGRARTTQGDDEDVDVLHFKPSPLQPYVLYLLSTKLGLGCGLFLSLSLWKLSADVRQKIFSSCLGGRRRSVVVVVLVAEAAMHEPPPFPPVGPPQRG